MPVEEMSEMTVAAGVEATDVVEVLTKCQKSQGDETIALLSLLMELGPHMLFMQPPAAGAATAGHATSGGSRGKVGDGFPDTSVHKHPTPQLVVRKISDRLRVLSGGTSRIRASRSPSTV